MTSNNKTNRTVEKNMDRIMELLSKLRFYGMLETYRNDCRTTSSDGMTNDEFLKWLLESEYDYRRNVSIERLIRSANFRYKAYMEKIDYTIKRNLDRNQLERLASLDFIKDGQNVFITGSSGTGKSYTLRCSPFNVGRNSTAALEKPPSIFTAYSRRSVSYRIGCQGKVNPYGNNRRQTRIKINHNNITTSCRKLV